MKKSALSIFARRLITALVLVGMVLPASLGIALPATPARAAATITYDGSPGNNAPPATLGGYTMMPFPDDPTPDLTPVISIPAPVGAVSLSEWLFHVNSMGTPNPNNPYSGDVYAGGIVTPTISLTLTMPANTTALYFYFLALSPATITAKANDGTLSTPVLVPPSDPFNNPYPNYHGFYVDAGYTIASINITFDSTNVFALQQFGIGYPTPPPPDLQIEKYVSDAQGNPASGPFIAGEEMFWTVRVMNAGLYAGFNVVVTDTLPSGMVLLAAEPYWERIDQTSQYRIYLGDIDPGQEIYFHMKTHIPPDAVASSATGSDWLHNQASVMDENGSDINPDDNTAEAMALVQDLADLRLTKMVKPDNFVHAGEVFTYTLFVDNLGPSYARFVTLRDEFVMEHVSDLELLEVIEDPGYNFSEATVQMDSSAPGGPRLFVEIELMDPLGVQSMFPMVIPDLPLPGRFRIQIIMRSNIDQDINNIANVFTSHNADNPGTPDPDMSNNQAIETISVLSTADLQITTSAVTPSVNAGEIASWNVTVVNNGPSAATNVQVFDLLPGGLVDASISALGGDCTLGTPGDPFDPMVCNLGNLGSGDSQSFTIQGAVKPDFLIEQPNTPASDYIDNDAWVTSDAFDPDTANNRDSDFILVTASADLSMQKFAVGSPVAGDVIHYEIQIRNAGPSSSANVTLRDYLPGKVEYLGASVQLPGHPGVIPLACALAEGSNVLFCPLGNVDPMTPSDTPIMALINVRIKPDATGSLMNSADVELRDTPDPNMANNSSTATIGSILTRVDLKVEKSSSPTPGIAGQELFYNLSVVNQGPSLATGVALTDELPAEATYLGDTGDCAYDPGEHALSCQMGNLMPGESGSVLVKTSLPPYLLATSRLNTLEIENFARVSSEEGELNNQDNEVSQITLVQDLADLSVLKMSKPDTHVQAGELFTYTILVDNLGPSFARGVALADNLISSGAFEVLDVIDDQLSLDFDLIASTSPSMSSPWTLPGALMSGFGMEVNPLVSKYYVTVDNYSISTPLQNGYHPFFVDTVPDGWLEYWESETPVCQSLLDGIVSGDLPIFLLKVWDVGGEQHAMLVDNYVYGCYASEVYLYFDGDFLLGNYAFKGTLTDQNGQTHLLTVPLTLAAPGMLPPLDPGAPLMDGWTSKNCSMPDPTPGLLNGDALILCAPVLPLEPQGWLPPLNGVSGRWKIQVVARANEAQDINNVVNVFTYNNLDLWPFLGTPDPNLGNNQAQDFISIDAAADLELTKTDNLGSNLAVAGGAPFTFFVNVHNAGPSTAQNVTVVDAMPAEVEALSYSASQPASCTIGVSGDSGNPTVCNLGQILPGESATLEFLVVVKPEFGAGTFPLSAGMFANNAWTYSETYDPDNADNRAWQPVGLLAEADLWINKTTEPGVWLAGNEYGYPIIIRNDGPSDAHQVVVEDQLPYWVNFTSAVLDNGVEFTNASCDITANNKLRCHLGDMQSGDQYRLIVKARVHESFEGNLYNTARVSSDTYDPDPNDNSDSVNKYVSSEADLELTKTGDPAKVFAGGQVKYTLTVTNHGPSTAFDVELNDYLPYEMDFETGPTACEREEGVGEVVACDMDYLLPGETRSFELWVRVLPNAEPGDNLHNRAEVWSDDTYDPDEENNYASAYTYVEGIADLRVTKFGKPDDEVRAGTPLTYTIVVDNFGPGYAHDVTILDEMVASGGFELLDLTSDRPADCDPPGNYMSMGVTCILDEALEPAGVGNVGRWMVTLVVSVNEPGSINNLARVSSADFDPDLSNNMAVVQHDISAAVDLLVSKTSKGEVMINGELTYLGEFQGVGGYPPHEGTFFDWPWGLTESWPDLPIASWVDYGHILTYTLTITNQGPSTAENIVLKDYLPEGVASPTLPVTSTLPLDFVVRRILPSQGSCQWGVIGDPAKPLTCYLGSLAGKAAAQVQIVVFIPLKVPVGTTYYNQVQVYNDLYDPDNSDNFDDLFTVVAPPLWLHFLPLVAQSASFPEP